jgi:tetratricopeptide (TPR) repeat protein
VRAGVRVVACAIVACVAPFTLAAQGGERVGFRAQVAPDTVYVGQQVTYTLGVRIPADIRQRLRRNPEFVPPEPRAMLAYDLPLARTTDPSAELELHTFRRALFVLTPGRYQIAAARLTYALPQSSSFFSREEERTIRSDAVSFVAINPPQRGRPAGWLGAVGQWTASARLEPGAPRVGDPFVLVLRLSGAGNATLLPRPPLEIAWADVVPQDERVVIDSTPTLLGGSKEFAWLVTPREAGPQRVPEIDYAYFDPTERRYAVTRSSALTVTVRPGTLVEVPPRAAASADTIPLPLRTALRGPSTLVLPGGSWWLWAAGVAPLPWLLIRTASRVRGRRTTREPAITPGTTRAILEQGVRTRTGLDVAAFTAPGALAAALRLEGVTAETAAEAEALRDACDAQGFGGARAQRDDPALHARASKFLTRLRTEARRKVLPLVLLCLGAGIATGCARPRAASEAAQQAFAEMRTAYVGRDYPRARDAAMRAARAAPRDAAAWANLGAAAWQAGDTAAAVLGWQRALRLDPQDARTRQVLRRVRAPQHRGAARVWPMPPLPLAVTAFTLWCAGWGLMAVTARRGGRSRIALVLLIAGAGSGAAAWWLDSTLAARRLVVIAEPTPIRALPALGADPGAMPITGEIARVLERRGVWLRVELDGGRTGWYPTERTWSLARD